MTDVSEEEVEAAAKEIFAAGFDPDWWGKPVWEGEKRNSLVTARAALTAAAQVRERAPQQGAIQGRALYEALKAAEYYIDRLERVQQRKVVRDMTEAMEHYRRVMPPVIEACYREITKPDLGPLPIYSSTEDTPAERMLDRTRLKAIADRIVDDYRPPATEDTPPKGEG